MDNTLYLAGQGLLYRLDPRAKFLFALSVLITLLCIQRPEGMLGALAILHILALSSSTRHRLISMWKILAPLMTMIIVLGSLRWQASDALWAIGPAGFTTQSIWQAIVLSGRIASLTLTFSLVLWTTEPGDAVAGLVSVGIPFELSFAALMAVQQIAEFQHTFRRILEGQQSRGLIISRRNPIRALRAYIPVLVPLLISALRRVDELTLALQSRGFGSSNKRSSRHILHLAIRDGIFGFLTWITLALLLWFDRSPGL